MLATKNFNKVLVTGGAGFIGSHLIPKILSEGMEVVVLDTLEPQVHGVIPTDLEWLDQPGIDFIRGSVTSRDAWAQALNGVTAVVHLAAETGTGQSMYEVARYNLINSQATALMFDVIGKMSHCDVSRVVLASSRSVYGEGAYTCSFCNSRVFPIARSAQALRSAAWEPLCPKCSGELVVVATRETDEIAPASIYAATKFAQEDLVRIAARSLGIDYVICRLQNVYGERQSLGNPYTGILSIFSTKLRRGNPLPLFEDGNESRDFVHVDDVTCALLRSLCVESVPNAVINVGSGVATTIADVARLLSLAFGVEPNLVVTGQFRIGDIRHNFADIGRLKTELGLEPKVSLADGLNRFMKWVTSQPLPADQVDKANQELRSRKLMD